jgi:heat shock protein HslJ
VERLSVRARIIIGVVGLAVGLAYGLLTTSREDPPEEPSPSVSASPSSTPAQEMTERWWILERGEHDGKRIRPVPGFDITFTIGDQIAGGRAGCNGYGGRRRFSEDELRIGSIGQNTAGCGDAVNDVEMRYTIALGEVTEYETSGDRLILEGPDTRLVFSEAPAIPVDDLVDATWHLRSILLRRGEKVRAKQAAPATLKLSEDGTLVATTGCSRITGEWEVAGPNINAESNVKGRCPRSDMQSQYLYAVLGEFTAVVQADTLTVFGVGGASTVGAIYSKE